MKTKKELSIERGAAEKRKNIKRKTKKRAENRARAKNYKK